MKPGRKNLPTVTQWINKTLSGMIEADQVYSWRKGRHRVYFNGFSVLYFYGGKLAEYRTWRRRCSRIDIFFFTTIIAFSGQGRMMVNESAKFVKWGNE